MIVLGDYKKSDPSVVQKQNEIKHCTFDPIKRIVVSFVSLFRRVQLYTNPLVGNINDVLSSVIGVYYVVTLQHTHREIYKVIFSQRNNSRKVL